MLDGTFKTFFYYQNLSSQKHRKLRAKRQLPLHEEEHKAKALTQLYPDNDASLVSILFIRQNRCFEYPSNERIKLITNKT